MNLPSRPKTNSEKAHEARVASLIRFMPNDDPIKAETRLRVHESCVLPADRVVGKYGPTPAAVCARCFQPAAEGRMVVTAVRRDERLRRLIGKCP